jgi:hypothetical protein
MGLTARSMLAITVLVLCNAVLNQLDMHHYNSATHGQ